MRGTLVHGVFVLFRIQGKGAGEGKSTGFSFRGPRFNSQKQNGGSQPYMTPVLGDPMLSSGL